MTVLKKPVRRVSNDRLTAAHGKDRNRRLIVTVIPGNGGDLPDLIEIRPERLQKPRRITLEDLYIYLIKCEVNASRMAKLREKKANKEAAAAKRKSNRIIYGKS